MKPIIIKSMPTNKKTYTISNFFECARFYKNLQIQKGKLLSGYKRDYIFALDKDMAVERVCVVNGRIYLVSSGKVYLFDDAKILVLTTYEGQFFGIYSIDFAGEQRVLMLTEQKAQFLDGDNEEVNLPNKKHAVIVGDKMFFGEDNLLTYGNALTLDGFFDLGKQILLPIDAGEIVELVKDAKELLIICKHAVFKLAPFGDSLDFMLERLNLPILNVLEQSVVNLGNNIAFISGTDVFMLKGENLKKIETAVGIERLNVKGKCTAFEGGYVIPFEYLRERFAYIINPMDESEQILSLDVIGEEGVFKNGTAVYRLDKKGNQYCGEPLYESVCLNLSTPKNKTLLNVYVDASKKAQIDIDTAFSKRQFALSIKNCPKKCGLTAREYLFRLSALEGFDAEKIVFEYRIKGE